MLARKYRPRNFSSVVGHKPVVQTLSYQLLNQKLSSAYIFNGTRGIGKTTLARILAKTINCLQSQAIISPKNLENTNDQSYLASTCEKCDNCQSFNNGSHPDIIEIDGASYTGVEDVRHLIDLSSYRPILGTTKLFIIDEVHMLSKNAFNALLKILEEPPAHVIFILATTEINKIPLTVSSRCQNFDLNRFRQNELAQLLNMICEKEQIKIENEALEMIIIKSDGSAREAIFLLEQAHMFTSACRYDADYMIDSASICKVLRTSSKNDLIDLLSFIEAKNLESALKLLKSLYNQNVNFLSVISDLSNLVGELSKMYLITNYLPESYLNYTEQLNILLKNSSLHNFTIMWQLLNTGYQELKQACNSQLMHMEMLVIKLIYATALPTPEEILNKLSQEHSTLPTISSIAPDSDLKKKHTFQ